MTAVGPATNVSRSTVQSPVKRLLPARTESILLLEIHDVSKTAASSAVNKPLNVEMNSRLHNCLLCFSPQQACQSLSSVIMGMARHMQSCQTKANCPPPRPPSFFLYTEEEKKELLTGTDKRLSVDASVTDKKNELQERIVGNVLE